MGSDRVVPQGRRLLIDAAAEMVDWEPRSYRRPAVRFEGNRYFVTGREPRERGRIRYVLEPWPADAPEDPVFEIPYDEEYVAVRDANRRVAAGARRVEPLLVALTPFIGLLPVRVKLALEERHGIDPRTATGRSLWLEYFLFLLAAVLLAITVWVGGITGRFPFSPRLLIAALVVLGLDGAMRYSNLKDEMEPPLGFYEWLPRALSRRR